MSCGTVPTAGVDRPRRGQPRREHGSETAQQRQSGGVAPAGCGRLAVGGYLDDPGPTAIGRRNNDRADAGVDTVCPVVPALDPAVDLPEVEAAEQQRSEPVGAIAAMPSSVVHVVS